MKTKLITLAAAGLIAGQVNAGTVTTDGADIIIGTKGGFSAKTSDGKYSFKIGGRAMIDFNDYDGVINDTTPGADGSDLFFRRARLEIKGHMEDWKYAISYNLTGSGSIDQLKTTYTGFGKMANLTIGQQKESFGLDDTGSSKWTAGVERSFVSDAFDTGNNMGIKLHGANDFMTYSLGVFKEGVDVDKDLDTATTGRLVIRPIYQNGTVLHLGAGVTHRNADMGFDDIDSRLGVRGGEDKNANKWEAKFASGDGDSFDAYNLEAAFSSGPLQIMAEYFEGEVEAPDAIVGSDDIKVSGYYGQISYFLTGESRKYKTGIAAFDKVKPSNARGAWEVFVRYSMLESDNTNGANNITLIGGEESEVATLGVNYYMNNNVKIAVDYVTSKTDAKISGKNDGNAIVARLQLAF